MVGPLAILGRDCDDDLVAVAPGISRLITPYACDLCISCTGDRFAPTQRAGLIRPRKHTHESLMPEVGVDLSALQPAAAGVIPMGSLPAHHAAHDPDRPAVTQDGVTVSWRELEARANRRARLFAAKGVGEGDFVTIALANGIEFYETSFA